MVTASRRCIRMKITVHRDIVTSCDDAHSHRVDLHTSDGPRGTMSVTLDTVLVRWRVSVHVAGVENEESWRGLDKQTSSQCNLHSQTHVATISSPLVFASPVPL